jgi:aminoglycoside phosphotransferase (APT) family kinase protein
VTVPPDDIQLDTAQVARIVRRQFPELPTLSVSYLDEGYDSRAFEVDGAWVFRFPKRAEVERQLQVEIRAVPELARTSPVPLPDHRFRGLPDPDCPYHFSGYRKLAGVPADHVDPEVLPVAIWAPALGRFLSWLHRFPIAEAARRGVERVDAHQLIDGIRTEALLDLERLVEVAPAAPVDRWRAVIAAGVHAGPAVAQAVVHRDLAAEHILCDRLTGTLTGVIDWTEISIGDPALDLACAFHWAGEAGFDAVMSVYDRPVDADVLERVRVFAAARGLGDVAFGLEMRRPESVATGLRAIELSLGGLDT